MKRLAAALQGLGIAPGDRVGTLCWNHQEHIEAYFAIPCMAAVLHTLNLGLPPAQLARTIDHAQVRVRIVDDSLAPLLASIIGRCPSVKKVIVVGSEEAPGLGEAIAYEDLIAAARSSLNGRASISAVRLRCATPPAPRAIRRVSPTAIVRCTCTRWPSGRASASMTQNGC